MINRVTVPIVYTEGQDGIGRIFLLKDKKALAIDVGAFYNVEAP